MRVLQICNTASRNPLGRAWSNWLALSSVGIELLTAVPSIDDIWAPVAGETDFVNSLMAHQAIGSVPDVDALVAIKPIPASLDVALRASRRLGVPVILDVDDPDFEAKFGMTVAEQAKNFILHGIRARRPPVRAYIHRLRAREADAVTLSNPALSAWYGRNEIVPHTRPAVARPQPGSSGEVLKLAFVGTNKPHKGVEEMRQAIRSLTGVQLTVTAPRPPDAMENEHWIGETSVADGRELIDRTDVMMIPSVSSVLSSGQLPAKLIDAMARGKAIIASDVPPVRWALGDAGVLVTPGSVSEMRRAVDTMRSPELRTELASKALERARILFAPDVVGETFRGVIDQIISGNR